jgi:hypothetical protein
MFCILFCPAISILLRHGRQRTGTKLKRNAAQGMSVFDHTCLFCQEDVRRDAGGSEADYWILFVDYVFGDISQTFRKNTECCQFETHIIALIARLIPDIIVRLVVVAKDERR